MDRFAELIIKKIDDGEDILSISKYFGGTDELLKMTEKYPYLQALVQTKLGGTLYCSAEGDDEVLIPFEIPFVILDKEEIDFDFLPHYNVGVNLIIPELTFGLEMQKLFTWMEDYLMDLGSEVGSFNDQKLNGQMIWVYVQEINGLKFKKREDDVSDQEILKVIPKEYIKE
jgi:hypothetical protein